MRKGRARQTTLLATVCPAATLTHLTMFIARRGAMMLASLVLLAACSAETTSPTQGAAAGDLLGGIIGGATGTVKTVLTSVVGLQRTTALAADITVTQSIGSAGGT